MIISEKNKYLFIQIAHTGSTAIEKDLIENYDGKKFLNKHSSLAEINLEDFKDYFIFASTRNPLDERISMYYKLKNNQRNLYRFDKKRVFQKRGYKMGNDIVNNNLSFHDYFRKYCNYYYVNPIEVQFNRYDFVMSFENLETDYKEAIKRIGIDYKNTLSRTNATIEKKEVDLNKYYPKPLRNKAVKLFSVYMNKFGYTFPENWPTPKKKTLSYSIFAYFKKLIWRLNG